MARKFDVSRALTLYEQHEATRVQEGLIRFEPTLDPLIAELETGKFTVLVRIISFHTFEAFSLAQTESPPEIVVHFEVILTLIVPCELSVFPLNFNALVLARTRESTGLFNLTVVIYECSVWHPISSVVCVRFICECRTNVCLHAVPVPSCTSYSTR